MVLFPGLVLPISVGRQRSVAAAQQAVREQRQVGILMQRDPEVNEPSADDMHRIGTVANVVRYITAPDGTNHLVCQGDQRFQVTEFLDGWPFMVARVLRIPEPEQRSSDIEARFLNLKAQATEALQLLPQAPQELLEAVQSVTSPGGLADLAAAYMDTEPAEKQEILETIDLSARMDKVARMLAHRIEVLRLSHEIGRQTKASLDERQREVLLREQMAAIQRQLGEGEEGKSAEMAELAEAITKAEHAQGGRGPGPQGAAPAGAHARGGGRIRHDPHLSRLAGRAALGLPEEARSTSRSARILDEDHYGLDKIKRRIVEYPGGAQAGAPRQGADPVLRRPAGRRQDLARPVDRARHGPQVRARQPRRRA
jgi:ATP-dependent Lon protease